MYTDFANVDGEIAASEELNNNTIVVRHPFRADRSNNVQSQESDNIVVRSRHTSDTTRRALKRHTPGYRPSRQPQRVTSNFVSGLEL